MMRQAYGVGPRLAAGAFCLLATVGLAGCDASASGPAPAAAAAPYRPAAPAPAAVPGALSLNATNSVSRVIDGDTFVLNGQVVRVLGIDSCELATAGGERAKVEAEGQLLGRAVTLRAEPGVDTDRYGRLLRYVDAAGADFGDRMVLADHTAVYEGENDASPAYVARLEEADVNARTCGDPTTTTTTAPPADEDGDGDSADDRDRLGVPDRAAPERTGTNRADSDSGSDRAAPNPDVDRPTRRPSSGGGRVGRDGDGDGLCNESTVPVPC